MKARCNDCYYLNYDFFSNAYEESVHDFCGLHGRRRVDVNGEQPKVSKNEGEMGECGYLPKVLQLELF